ncbi:hypothetical protein SH449x_001855 [Pirellulaceae bacterium SH449]
MSEAGVIEILELVDRGWQNRCPLPVSELLNSVGDGDDLNSVSEVLAADSEWRWRVAGYSAEASAFPMLGSKADRKPHSVEHYLREIPQLGESQEYVLKLIESEFLARSRWGNPPTIAEFVDRFPEIGDLSERLVRALDEHAPMWVAREGKVVSQSQSPRVMVQTPLIAGRRTKEERNSNWLSNESQRLLVAENEEPGVSREHVRITRVAIDRVLIVNISSQGILGINGVDVLPGSAQQLLLPVTLDVGSSRLRLEVW